MLPFVNVTCTLSPLVLEGPFVYPTDTEWLSSLEMIAFFCDRSVATRWSGWYPGSLRTFRGALFFQKYPCTSCFTLSAVIMGDGGGSGSWLFSRALPLCYLITFEHFKVNKLYKIFLDKWLNDWFALIFPLIFLVVFIMPYIFFCRVPSQLYLWSQARKVSLWLCHLSPTVACRMFASY